MRKLRYFGLGGLIVTAGLGLYFVAVYDPDAPRSDWPVLQAAEVADGFKLRVSPSIQVTANLSRFVSRTHTFAESLEIGPLNDSNGGVQQNLKSFFSSLRLRDRLRDL